MNDDRPMPVAVERRPTGIAAAVIAALALPVLVILPAEPAAASRKTLARFHDAVVVRTSFAGALPSADTARLRLYRAASTPSPERRLAPPSAADTVRLEPIPYQFDPANADGELDTREVIGADFVLDEDDQLVFMARDTGDRLESAHTGHGEVAFEIEVADPDTGERGWAYLLSFREAPPLPSPVRYVRFDRARNEAHSEFYTARYDPVLDQLSGLSLGRAGGGNGQNLLRATRMWGRPTFSLLLTSWSPEFDDRNTRIVVEGIRVGPVRAIRTTSLKVDLGKFFPELPRGRIDVQYYASSFFFPARVSIPSLALKVLRDFRFETVSEFDAAAAGMRYWDGANPRGVELGAGDSVLDRDRDHEWWAVSGAPGSYLQAFLIPEKWKSWGIVRGTVFEGGGGEPDADRPDTLRVGYSLLNMTRIREGGDHELKRATVVLPRPYASGDELDALAMYKEPLRAEVRKLERILAAETTD